MFLILDLAVLTLIFTSTTLLLPSTLLMILFSSKIIRSITERSISIIYNIEISKVAI